MQRFRIDPRFDADALTELSQRAEVELAVPDMSEEDVARFLVARNSNVDAALKQMKAACVWCDELMSSPLTCPCCESDPSAHSHVPIGLESSASSAIVYGCPARATERGVDETLQHVALQCEYLFSLPETGSRWVWVVDYNGFRLSHALQGRLAARFATTFSHYMPERLHKILLINPPVVFDVMLKALRPFVDAVTLAKIVPIHGTHERVLSELKVTHAFPEDAIRWLAEVLRSPTKSRALPPLPAAASRLLLPGLQRVFKCED